MIDMIDCIGVYWLAFAHLCFLCHMCSYHTWLKTDKVMYRTKIFRSFKSYNLQTIRRLFSGVMKYASYMLHMGKIENWKGFIPNIHTSLVLKGRKYFGLIFYLYLLWIILHTVFFVCDILLWRGIAFVSITGQTPGKVLTGFTTHCFLQILVWY